MKFTDFFIKRPVFASCLSLLLLAIGFIGFSQLELRQYPKLETSTISISTTYNGANASLVESFVTTPLENAISGVTGVDYMTSTSEEGKSSITIYMILNSDINQAITDINTNIAKVKRTLPDNVDDPIIRSSDSHSTADLIMVFSSDRLSSEAISDYITRTIQPQLANLPGVGTVDILGQHTYAMRIWLNAAKMAAHHITATDVNDALKDDNIQSEAGQIDRELQSITINAETTLEDKKDFENLVIKNADGKLVRLKDIATVELGSLNTTSSMFTNGHSGVGVSISSKSDANPLTVDKAVKETMARIQPTLPSGLTYTIPRDSSLFIQQSINEVVRAISEASILVILVIFLFLGSVRSTLIPVVTIPLSIVTTFAIMYLCGYSINILTLLAFVLAIGMVVDDAIVVLENIHRHVEQGMKPFDAAVKGAREIAFAVIAMTITLSAVYVPIGFSSGFTGTLFREFAFTLAGAVIVSGFIALTLSPMMCSKVMKAGNKENGFTKKIEHVSHVVTDAYRRLLTWVLQRRYVVLILFSGILISGLIIFVPFYLTSRLAPNEDQGVIMSIGQGPSSANLNYTEKYTSPLFNIYKNYPEITNYAVINGIPDGEGSALSFVTLTDYQQRDKSADEISTALREAAVKISGLNFMFINPPSLPGSRSMYPFQFVIKTNGSYEELYEITNEFIAALQKNPRILFARSDLQIDKPEISVTIDRDKAARLGVSMSDIGEALRTAFGQPQNSTFVMNGKTYYAVPQVIESQRDSANAINNTYVMTNSGKPIALSTIVSLSNAVTANSLNHFQQQRATTINMALAPSYSTKAAMDYVETLAQKILTSDMSYDFSGDTRTFLESGNTMGFLFAGALIFIYLVLSAQFESFRDPLVVLFTVPLSLVGALFTLFLVGGSLNIYTEIGLLTLVGLITKHGILIVEFSNQLQRKGMSRVDSVINAAAQRFRPILMTTVAMVLGVLPLVLASGAGAEARSQMGWVIFGGMSFGTLLTLFVIPTIYTFLAKKNN